MFVEYKAVCCRSSGSHFERAFHVNLFLRGFGLCTYLYVCVCNIHEVCGSETDRLDRFKNRVLLFIYSKLTIGLPGAFV